jgi:hypothetical protein
MRNQETLALLTVAIFVVACEKPTEKQSAAVTSPAATNLDIAPRTYTRMGFVSELEQSKTRTTAKAPSHAPRSTTLSHSASAPDPIASITEHPLTVATTTEAAPAQQPIVMGTIPAPQFGPMAAPPTDSYIDHSAEGDGLLTGARVVIRGGMVGEHKCDPRSDAQARGELAGRPNSSMPLMPRSSVFW